MGLVAGAIGIKFVSDLRDVRRDLRELRSDAERPIRFGGSGGSAGVNGGRGIAARVRAGNRAVRLGGGRRELTEDLINRELGSEYLAESNRYGDNRRRSQERRLAAVDRVAARMQRDAAADDRRRERADNAAAQLGLRSELSGSRGEASRRQGVIREQEQVFRQLEREHRQRTTAQERQSQRVDRNFDAAALAQQRQEEREAGRQAVASRRASSRNFRLRQDAELAEARTPGERRTILAGRLNAALPGSDDALRIRQQIARVDRQVLRQREREASSAQRLADQAARSAAQTQQQSRRDAARTDHDASRLRRATLAADVSSARTPRERVEILERALSQGEPGTPEYERIRGRLGAARRGTLFGRIFSAVLGGNLAFRALGSVVSAGLDQEAYVQQRRSVAANGNRMEDLRLQEQHRVEWNGGFRGIYTGATDLLEGSGPLVNGAPGNSQRRLAITRARMRDLSYEQGGVQGDVGAISMNASARDLRMEGNRLSIRDPFARRRREAQDTYFSRMSALDDQDQAMQMQLDRGDLSPDARADLQGRLDSFRKNRPRLNASIAGNYGDTGQSIDLEERMAVTQQRVTNQAGRLAMGGFDAAAAVAGVNAKFLPVFGKDGKVAAFANGDIPATSPQFAVQTEAYGLAMQQASVDVSRTRIAQGSSIRSGLLRLARNPVDAQFAEIDAQEQSANLGLSVFSPQYWLNRTGAAVQRANVRQQFRDQEQLLDLNIGTRKNSLDALLERSPIGSGLAETVGSTKSEMLRMRQEGYGNLEPRIRDLGLQQLNVTRQQYLDSLQGQQLSSQFELDPQNRGGESPVVVLKRIEQAIRDLGS